MPNDYNWLDNSIDPFTQTLKSWNEHMQGRQKQAKPDRSGQSAPSPSDIPLNEIIGLAQQMHGSNPLNEQEGERLTELSQRQRRLQPLETDSIYGGSRIPGNPYSTDSRNFATGAANLVKGVMNSARRKRREGFEGELTDLEGRQQQAQQAQQAQSELIGEMVPEAFSQSQQNYRNQQDNERMIRQEEIKGENAINRIERKAELEKELDKHGGLSGAPPSIVTKYLDFMTKQADLDEIGIERMLDERQAIQENNIMSDDEKKEALNAIDENIQNVYDRIINKSQETAKLIEDMGYVPKRARNQEEEQSGGGAKFDPTN